MKQTILKNNIFQKYHLPGIERILKKDRHLEQNIGKEIEIKLFRKDQNGKKQYQGILKEFNQEKLIIENNEVEIQEEVEIERKNIAQIKTIFHW